MDLKMSVMKPLGACWLVNLYDYISSNRALVEKLMILKLPAYYLDHSMHRVCTTIMQAVPYFISSYIIVMLISTVHTTIIIYQYLLFNN